MIRSLVLILPLVLGGCARKAVDRFVVERVVPRGLAVADLGKACALGEAFSHPLAAVSAPDRPPREAMVIAELTAGVCAEQEGWEAELAAIRALEAGRTTEVRDARIRADRARAIAADRYSRAFVQMQAAYGPVGEGDCPRLKESEEVVYLVGLVTGLLGVLHDKASGGTHEVPLDRVAAVGRGASCLADEAWWHVPSALQASAWATIPGSGPEGIDPWAALAEHAAAGERTGVRIARALQVLVAGNAGRAEVVREGILAHAESLKATSPAPEWVLLDEYARRVTQHQSDLLWTREEGYRTPALGELPGEEAEIAPPPPDPFGADPFAEPGETQP